KATVRAAPGSELVSLRTSSGETIAALYGPALSEAGEPVADPRKAPTLLYFYGNGTCLKTAQDQFEQFRRAGANVMIAEYVGYGMSTGRPSEAGCYATADAAYDYLRSRPDVDPARIVAAGGSLGGAVAIDLASRKPVAGLITFMTFTSLPEVAQKHFPLVPTSPLLRYRFDSVAKMRQIHCPVLLAHGTSDLLVPHRMMDRLAGAAAAPVTKILVSSATHYNLFHVGERPIAEGLRKFLTRI
ncbi:MAG: Dienelactone hydrolase family protein, partial [Armatimonadetes bacterium]|nr:Dienelactone hydrolase family protein [Armatimonadota bacterium]